MEARVSASEADPADAVDVVAGDAVGDAELAPQPASPIAAAATTAVAANQVFVFLTSHSLAGARAGRRTLVAVLLP
jgi:hypothetical protein